MKWPRNAWYVAGYSQELLPGKIMPRVILGTPVALARDGKGQVFALRDRCPHRGVALSLGRVLDSGHLKCVYHGLQFDREGHCVHNPYSRGHIPAALKVERYAVIERYGMIWVWMSERDPDPARMPDYPMMEAGSGFVVNLSPWIRMSSPCDLVIDNLMDLSHASYLHEGLLGNEAMILGGEVRIEQGENSVSVIRRFVNQPLPEYLNLIYMADGSTGVAWQSVHWRAPSYCLIDNGVHEPGKTPEEGGHVYSAHILTPETETTTLYHIIAARRVAPGRKVDEAAVDRRLVEMRRIAFTEQDDPVIQSQRRAFVADPDFKPVLLSIDKGVVLWRRLLEKQMANEAAGDHGS